MERLNIFGGLLFALGLIFLLLAYSIGTSGNTHLSVSGYILILIAVILFLLKAVLKMNER